MSSGLFAVVESVKKILVVLLGCDCVMESQFGNGLSATYQADITNLIRLACVE